eukprot:559636-Alexandrium_andersonii.AAC.1
MRCPPGSSMLGVFPLTLRAWPEASTGAHEHSPHIQPKSNSHTAQCEQALRNSRTAVVNTKSETELLTT